MDNCAQLGLLAFDDALTRMHQQLKPLQQTECIALPLALDRVLAEPILATINVPSADNSAMDGYAVRSVDCTNSNNELQLIGQALAGHPFTGELGAGEAVRIMTGAIIPTGADAIVMQENTVCDNTNIIVNTAVTCGSNLRRAGEDIKNGSLVCAQGHRISALDIGLLASVGVAEVIVYRQLRVAILSTGDELLTLGATPEAGKIFDSNRPLLAALLQRLSVDIKDIGIVADNLNALREAFTRAMEWADVVISTGGVSVGDADYTKDILVELGQVDFWKIAMKPGKPFAFGYLGAGYFFGLPGNPVSTLVTYHQLVVPSLRYLSGEIIDAKNTIPLLSAKTQQRLKKQPGRVDFQRGILSHHLGGNQVRSAGVQSSGVLTGMVNANCYIRLESERSTVAENETVTIIPFDAYIR